MTYPYAQQQENSVFKKANLLSFLEKVHSISSPSSCRCSELLTDVEGIKLDQVISERETQSNTHSIMEINDVLIKLQADFDELRRQIDNFKEETTNSLQNYAKQIPSFEYSNSEQQGIPNGNNQKSPNDNCVNNQLSAEINNHNEIHLPVNKEDQVSIQLQDYRSKQKNAYEIATQIQVCRKKRQKAYKKLYCPPSGQPKKVNYSETQSKPAARPKSSTRCDGRNFPAGSTNQLLQPIFKKRGKFRTRRTVQWNMMRRKETTDMKRKQVNYVNQEEQVRTWREYLQYVHFVTSVNN